MLTTQIGGHRVAYPLRGDPCYLPTEGDASVDRIFMYIQYILYTIYCV